MLDKMLEEQLIDYVALDFKAPSELFFSITGFDGYDSFERSLALLVASGIGLEVRTTVHADLLDGEDINSIIHRLEEVGFRGTYYLQIFHPGKTLGNIGPPLARPLDPSKLLTPLFKVCSRA